MTSFCREQSSACSSLGVDSRRIRTINRLIWAAPYLLAVLLQFRGRRPSYSRSFDVEDRPSYLYPVPSAPSLRRWTSCASLPSTTADVKAGFATLGEAAQVPVPFRGCRTGQKNECCSIGTKLSRLL